MDFVASRANEKAYGWRNRIGQVLRSHGATVFDPWFKPIVHGLEKFGLEDEKSVDIRNIWSFAPGAKGAAARAQCARNFRDTVHIDLRMVDLSDFIIAYCPTNLYSVGTPHEIVMARLERKPVLFVSPPVAFDALADLKREVGETGRIAKLVKRLENDVPIKPNQGGLPSLWYMGMLDPESFFDGFGFAPYAKRFKWKRNVVDDREERYPVKRPLMGFLQDLAAGRFPRRWEPNTGRFVKNDDWLVLDLEAGAGGAARPLTRT
jgi:hypothetical protein